MKKNFPRVNLMFFALLILYSLTACTPEPTTPDCIYPPRKPNQIAPAFQSGDIIFQTSNSRQSKAIQLATHSPYSHVGIIYQKEGSFWVYEAIEPVQLTPLKTWIKRGQKEQYVVKRLRNADQILDEQALHSMKTIGKQYMGKHYDFYFEWSDDRIYCSELVWKIYKKAIGVELGQLQTLESFDLTDDEVQRKLQERYKGAIPLDEKVISPVAIFESELLITVPN